MPVCIVCIDSFSECKNKTNFWTIEITINILIFTIIFVISIAQTFYTLILYSADPKDFENS